MESIISTFVGIFFPHTIEIDEASDKAYFLLYETYSARYSVKVIADKILVESTLKAYDLSWDFISITNVTYPLLIVATGLMAQQPSTSGFLGRAVEEKFHLRPFVLKIIPCIPIVTERLKDLVHPEVGPTQLGTGAKEGYFFVNLSLNQNFDNEPEFYTTSAANEELNEYEAELLANINNGEKHYRPDDDEIVESPEGYGQNLQDSYSENGSLDLFNNTIVEANLYEHQDLFNDYEKLHKQIQDLGDISVNENVAKTSSKQHFINDSDNESYESATSNETIKHINKAINHDLSKQIKGNVISVKEEQFLKTSLYNSYSDTFESNEYDSSSSITRRLFNASINKASESSKSKSYLTESQQRSKIKKDKQANTTDTKMKKHLTTKKKKGKEIANFIPGDELNIFSSNESSPFTFSGYASDRSYDNVGSSSKNSHTVINKPLVSKSHGQSSSCNKLPYSEDASSSEYESSQSNTSFKRRQSSKESNKLLKKFKGSKTATQSTYADVLPEHSPIIRGRGRPKKIEVSTDSENSNQIKRARGRPKKEISDPQTGEINKYFFKFAFTKK